jgi:hypothetical protein
LHLYWNKSENNTLTPKKVPPRLRSDRAAAAKWLAKQALYHDQACPLCGAKETQDHALSHACQHVRQASPKLEDVFKTIIEANGGANTHLIKALPKWYGEEPASPMDTKVPAFDILATYDKRVGRTGTIPKALTEALHFFGLRKDGAANTARALGTAVAAHYHGMWRERCRNLYNPTDWSRAQRAGNTQVATGIT